MPLRSSDLTSVYPEAMGWNSMFQLYYWATDFWFLQLQLLQLPWTLLDNHFLEYHIPSGKLTVGHWTWPIKIVETSLPTPMTRVYVNLLEGTPNWNHWFSIGSTSGPLREDIGMGEWDLFRFQTGQTLMISWAYWVTNGDNGYQIFRNIMEILIRIFDCRRVISGNIIRGFPYHGMYN